MYTTDLVHGDNNYPIRLAAAALLMFRFLKSNHRFIFRHYDHFHEAPFTFFYIYINILTNQRERERHFIRLSTRATHVCTSRAYIKNNVTTILLHTREHDEMDGVKRARDSFRGRYFVVTHNLLLYRNKTCNARRGTRPCHVNDYRFFFLCFI